MNLFSAPKAPAAPAALPTPATMADASVTAAGSRPTAAGAFGAGTIATSALGVPGSGPTTARKSLLGQ